MRKEHYPTFDIRHAADFLLSATAEPYSIALSEKPGKDEVDAEMARLAIAVKKWEASFGKSDLGKAWARDDVQKVMELSGGYSFVRLLSPAALAYEGRVMEHCVGEGRYDDLTSGSGLTEPGSTGGDGSGKARARQGIYSVRSPDGEPRATIEVVDGAAQQIKGRRNGHVSPDAAEATFEALTHLGITVDESDLKHIGYVAVPKKHKNAMTFKTVTLGGGSYAFVQSMRLKDGIDLAPATATDILNEVYLSHHMLPDTETLRQLLDSRASLRSTKFFPKAMHIAAALGNLAAVKLLLPHVLDIDEEDAADGLSTAIEAAAREDNVDVAVFLAESGACARSVATAFKLAACNGRLAIVEALLPFIRDDKMCLREGLRFAYDSRDVSVVKYLVEHGAEINQSTDIFAALYTHNHEIIKFLVDSGADLEAKNHQRYRPLDYAVKHNLPEVVKLLLAAGAKWSRRFKHEIRIAQEFRHPEMESLLKSLAADAKGQSRTVIKNSPLLAPRQ